MTKDDSDEKPYNVDLLVEPAKRLLIAPPRDEVDADAPTEMFRLLVDEAGVGVDDIELEDGILVLNYTISDDSADRMTRKIAWVGRIFMALAHRCDEADLPSRVTAFGHINHESEPNEVLVYLCKRDWAMDATQIPPHEQESSPEKYREGCSNRLEALKKVRDSARVRTWGEARNALDTGLFRDTVLSSDQSGDDAGVVDAHSATDPTTTTVSAVSELSMVRTDTSVSPIDTLQQLLSRAGLEVDKLSERDGEYHLLYQTEVSKSERVVSEILWAICAYVEVCELYEESTLPSLNILGYAPAMGAVFNYRCESEWAADAVSRRTRSEGSDSLTAREKVRESRPALGNTLENESSWTVADFKTHLSERHDGESEFPKRLWFEERIE